MNLAAMYISSGSNGAKSASPFWISFKHSNLITNSVNNNGATKMVLEKQLQYKHRGQQEMELII